jgi:hypothetical protein
VRSFRLYEPSDRDARPTVAGILLLAFAAFTAVPTGLLVVTAIGRVLPREAVDHSGRLLGVLGVPVIVGFGLLYRSLGDRILHTLAIPTRRKGSGGRIPGRSSPRLPVTTFGTRTKSAAGRSKDLVMLPFPAQLIVHTVGRRWDGGTLTFHATDEEGFKHLVVLNQRMFLEIKPSPGQIPGRLYFDGWLLGVRSSQEAQLLQLMRAATIRIDLNVIRVACLDWYDTNSEPSPEPPRTEDDLKVKGLRDELDG